MGYDGSWQNRGLSTTTGRFDGERHKCGKWRHRSSQCWEPKRTESKVVNEVTVTVISPMREEGDTFVFSIDHEVNVVEHYIIPEHTSDGINVARQSCAPNSELKQ